MKPMLGMATALMLVAGVPATAKNDEPPKLSEEQLRPFQQRDFTMAKDDLFVAAVSMLQASGYRDINANRDAGTISAQTDAKSKVIYNIIWGLGKKKLTQTASIFIEPRGNGMTRLRVGLSTVETKSRIYGVSSSDGAPVPYAQPYADFFATLEREVATRQAEAAAAEPPLPTLVVPAG